MLIIYNYLFQKINILRLYLYFITHYPILSIIDLVLEMILENIFFFCLKTGILRVVT